MQETPGADITLAEVAVDSPLRSALTYLLPPSLAAQAAIGKRALVPLGKRKVTGYILGFPETTSLDPAALKSVIDILDPEPLISPPLVSLLKWAASYYLAAPAEAMRAALPAGINVSSKKVAALTQEGRAALEAAEQGKKTDIAATDLAALAAIAGTGDAGKVPEPRLKRLISLGLAGTGQELCRARVKVKTGRGFEFIAFPDEKAAAAMEKRAPERMRFLRELQGKGEVAASALRDSFKDPARLAKPLLEKGFVRAVEIEGRRDPFSLDLPIDPPPENLNEEQERAYAEVAAALGARAFQVFLLQGVTGSGKTEVYLRAIEKAAKDGGGAIMLAPEIALTPQLAARFRQRFPTGSIALLHSGLSDGERFDEWRRIKSGEARVVIGARSAVFAPVADLRLIIVDEEHEGAYKQDHGFMYNARDLAVMRGREEKAAVILGSATPSLESSHRARQENGYRLLTLTRRATPRPLPEVEVVDLKQTRLAQDPTEEKLVRDRDRLPASLLFSPVLLEAMNEVLARQEQVILFLNRRGVFSFMVCFDCGKRLTCPNCEVSLVHHRAMTKQNVDNFYGEPDPGGYLLCHHCGFHEPMPEVCPACRGVRVKPFGIGTEEIEKTVSGLFPEARVLRVDSDSMRGRESYHRVIDRVSRREADIVVGTQILAKGHDLPGVTLVGVLLADLSLNLPDFRSAERTFQMITQVAGRAGRGAQAGRVIVQTFEPGHYAVRLAAAQDYEAFYAEESRRREALMYPPFSRVACLRVAALDPKAAKDSAGLIGRVAKARAGRKEFAGKVRVLGPAPAPLSRLAAKYRHMLLIKAETPPLMSAFLELLVNAIREKKLPSSIAFEIDRDPMSLM